MLSATAGARKGGNTLATLDGWRRIVRTGHAKFKQVRHFAALAATMVVAGCASLPPSVPAPEKAPAHTQAQPLARLQVATLPPERDAVEQLLRGEFALGKGDLKQAADAYGKAAEVSNDPKIAERAVGLAIAVHRPQAARRAWVRWRALGASPRDLQRARAELALSTGDSDEARQALMALTADGKDASWRAFGRVLLHTRDQALAGRLLIAVASPGRLPAHVDAWLAMSEMGMRFGRRDYANRLAKEAMQRFHTGTAYAWAAELKLKDGDLAAARGLFERAYRRAPKDAHVRLAYAALLAHQKQEKQAEAVLAGGPQTAETFEARTAYAAHAKDKVTLQRIYAQLSAAGPQVRQSSYFLLGQLAELLNKPRQAVDWYAQVSDDDRHAFDADLRRAVLMYAQGEHAQAHALAERMQDDYSDDADAVRKSAQLDAELYMNEHDYPRAIAAYSAALKAKPKDADVLYGRGVAYAEAGQMKQSIGDLRRVLELRPDDIDAANALGYTLADNDQDLDEATTLLTKARTARPDDPAIADSWGWLQYRLGHLQRAELSLRLAWKARRDAEVGAHLAQVLWTRGDKAEARRVLGEAVALDPHNASLLAVKRKMTP